MLHRSNLEAIYEAISVY